MRSFEPSGFTRNPAIRSAASIIDYVFRWMACEFVPGYRAASSPTPGQAELLTAVAERYPTLTDDGFVRDNLHRWLS